MPKTTYEDIIKESPRAGYYIRMMNVEMRRKPQYCGGSLFLGTIPLYELAREACKGTTHLPAILRILYKHGIYCIMDFDYVAESDAVMRSWKGVGPVYGDILVECLRIRKRQIDEDAKGYGYRLWF